MECLSSRAPPLPEQERAFLSTFCLTAPTTEPRKPGFSRALSEKKPVENRKLRSTRLDETQAQANGPTEAPTPAHTPALSRSVWAGLLPATPCSTSCLSVSLDMLGTAGTMALSLCEVPPSVWFSNDCHSSQACQVGGPGMMCRAGGCDPAE